MEACRVGGEKVFDVGKKCDEWDVMDRCDQVLLNFFVNGRMN